MYYECKHVYMVNISIMVGQRIFMFLFVNPSCDGSKPIVTYFGGNEHPFTVFGGNEHPFKDYHLF